MTEKKQSALIQYLYQLAAAKDRGALAAIRRGAGKSPGTETATFPYVVPFIPRQDEGLHRAWPYFCVAALFATNPQHTLRPEGFGMTYRRLKESDSRDARFRSLLNAHQNDLPKLLRQAVRQLAADEMPLNWELLLADLKAWSHPDHYVQRRWAQQYWADHDENADEP